MTNPADAGPAPAGPGETGGPGGPEPARPRRQWRRPVIETASMAACAVVLALLLRTFVVQTFWIPSPSMVPTLDVNDRIAVQKAFFNAGDLHEGDIVVFSHPPLDRCPGSQSGDLVKRVIGLPGQTIYSSGNTVYIDGRPLAEPYLPADDPLGPAIASRAHPFRIPAGEYYMMGDNRAISCDSRYWGPVRGSAIVGKVIGIWWRDGHPYVRGA